MHGIISILSHLLTFILWHTILFNFYFQFYEVFFLHVFLAFYFQVHEHLESLGCPAEWILYHHGMASLSLVAIPSSEVYFD